MGDALRMSCVDVKESSPLKSLNNVLPNISWVSRNYSSKSQPESNRLSLATIQTCQLHDKSQQQHQHKFNNIPVSSTEDKHPLRV